MGPHRPLTWRSSPAHQPRREQRSDIPADVTHSKETGRDSAPMNSPSLRWPIAQSGPWRQVRTFAIIGVVSTAAYAVLYALLRVAVSAPIANAIALLATAIANTAANRRLTFEVRSNDGLGRDHLAGLVAFGVALVITTASLTLLRAAAPSAGRVLELTVLIAANVAATVVRFALLRSWIASPDRNTSIVTTTTERMSR